MGSKPNRRQKLVLRAETLRRLATGDLAEVAGGRVAQRCTWEVSNCGHTDTGRCTTESIECLTVPCALE